MTTILHIETATKVCSVALSVDGELKQLQELKDDGYAHGEQLTILIQQVLDLQGITSGMLSAVSVSAGPGSYTGLRIGVSTAKGLCYALGIPLIAVNTLKSMAAIGKMKYPDLNLCPMIDARRMEVYATFFDRSLNVVRETSADIVDENSYLDLLNKQKIAFFGNGASKCRSVITHPNARFIEEIHPLASGMVPLAEAAFRDRRFEDAAYFEPFYLKEFVATIPRNKVIDLKK